MKPIAMGHVGHMAEFAALLGSLWLALIDCDRFTSGLKPPRFISLNEARKGSVPVIVPGFLLVSTRACQHMQRRAFLRNPI